MFLTLEDPRARVKGSRDPLGVQPIWTRFARHLIGNLTQTTTSVRNFKVLLLGRWFGELLLEEGRIGEDGAVDVFLRVEQVCGYARFVEPKDYIPGKERIGRRFASETPVATIGIGPQAEILSDQRAYGIWGQFTVAARVSELIPAGPVGLTPLARKFVVRHYRPLLDRLGALPEFSEVAVNGCRLSLNPPDPLLTAAQQLLVSPLTDAERAFYRRYVCDGERCPHLPAGRQAHFRRLLESQHQLDQDVSREELASIRKAAQVTDSGLARRIGRILTLEALLAPAQVLFGFLQARHGQTPLAIATAIDERWGRSVPNLVSAAFDQVRGEIREATGPEVTECMAGVHAAFQAGDYQTAIHHLLEWNRFVMLRRSASPWLRMDDRGALEVRFRGVEAELPTAEEMTALWRNGYFVASLKQLVAQTARTSGGDAS